MLRVSDSVRNGIRPIVPQPPEWERIGNEINTAMIFAPADFVNGLSLGTLLHCFPRASLLLVVWLTLDVWSV